MREIKYRGKVISDGYWTIGDLITETDVNFVVKRTFIHLRLSEINFKQDSIGSIVCLHEVDPETVGQYIGLKDSNGTEIYENDIIKITYNKGFEENPFYIGQVTYGSESDYPAFDLVPWIDCEMNALSWLKSDCDESVESYEVIGNIYENSELAVTTS